MHEVSVTQTFSSAHNLRGYKGKCEELHGHNWTVEMVVSAQTLNSLGMVEDFTVLKGYLREVLELLDHKYLNDVAAFVTVNPTSENIAKYIFESVKVRLTDPRLSLKHVRVWETATSCATYFET